MSVYYFDSSALVKRYCYETGSLWVRHLAAPEQGNSIFTAHITGIEVVAAIARKARMREMSESDATTSSAPTQI
jgi:predicted nucleic acid-binding protein